MCRCYEEVERESKENEHSRKEASLGQEQREKVLCEKYKVQREIEEDERRSKLRVSRTAGSADEGLEGGGPTSTGPGGVSNPAGAEPEAKMDGHSDEEDPVVCSPGEIIERLMDDLRMLPPRGTHPYVQHRERHRLAVVELMSAKVLGDANMMLGDRMTTIMKRE